MFIRRSKTKSGSTQIQVMEKRDRKNRLVKHIGTGINDRNHRLQNQKMRYDRFMVGQVKNKSTLVKSLSLVTTLVLLLLVWYEMNWVYPAEHDRQNQEWLAETAGLKSLSDDELINQDIDQPSKNTINDRPPIIPTDTSRSGDVAGVAVETIEPTTSLETSTTIELSQLEAAQIVKVVDGDTVKVDLDGQIETIRLVSVDAPESVAPGQPVGCLGKESARFLKNLLLNQSTLYLQKDQTQSDRDRYGRLLRFVFLSDGRDAGLELLKVGLAAAKLYSRQPHQHWSVYQEAEMGAKNQRLGIWDEEKCPT